MLYICCGLWSGFGAEGFLVEGFWVVGFRVEGFGTSSVQEI